MRLNTPLGLFPVTIADNPLTDDEGLPLDARTDFGGKEIEVCPTCLMNDRPQAVYHEYAHTWLRWAGLPKTDEQACDLFARMFAGLMADVMKQGGPDALLLMDMMPAERFDAACYSLTLNQLGAEHLYQCCSCQQRIAGGSVLASPPRHDPTIASMVVDLAFYCENCDHVQAWAGFASKTGKPTGAMASPPVYLKGAERDAFLIEHGETCGVFVSPETQAADAG